MSRSVKAHRTLTIIPLLKEDPEYRQLAIDFVDIHLEFSINKLHLEDYSDCVSNYEKSVFASEVIKCMIASDISAKKLFSLEEKYDSDYEPYEDDESIGFVSHHYVKRIKDTLRANEEDTLLRLESYNILSNEDRSILRSDELDSNPPEIQIACLTDKKVGHMGMIYTFLKTYDYEYEDPHNYYPKDESAEARRQKFDVLAIYGIRSTVFSQDAKQKGIAQSLITGLAKYALSVKVPVLHVMRAPIGPMRRILLNAGFNHDFYAYSSNIESNEDITVVNIGCEEEILKSRNQWLHLDTERRSYWYKPA